MIKLPTKKHFFCTLLACLFVMAGLVSAKSINSIEIDEKATAQAPWKIGEKIQNSEFQANLKSLDFQNVYRVFLGVTPKSYYVVQDFYADNHQKLTDPYVVKTKEDVVTEEYLSDDMQVEGIFTVWYPEGKKYYEVKKVNGKAEGRWIFLHRNGRLAAVSPHINGKRDGWEEGWDINGQMIKKCLFKEDRLDGLCTSWHDNGQKAHEGTWVKGNPVGLENWWHENGQLQAQGYRDANGLLDGEWKRWDSDGTLLRRTWYKEDKIIKREEFSKKK